MRGLYNDACLCKKWISRSAHALPSISKGKKFVFGSVESSMLRIMQVNFEVLLLSPEDFKCKMPALMDGSLPVFCQSSQRVCIPKEYSTYLCCLNQRLV